jgi:hypothetical protein
MNGLPSGVRLAVWLMSPRPTKRNDLPSAADLDRVAEEDRIRIATKRTERCPCCGSVLDSPHKSDDEAILACYQCTHNIADESHLCARARLAKARL